MRRKIDLPKVTLIEVGDRRLYHLYTPTGDIYSVDAQTGEVVDVIYDSIRLPDVPQEKPPSDSLPLPQLRSISQTIAEQKYPQFKTKRMILHKPYWDGYTFSFQFQEQLPNRALTGNLCLIQLLPDGRLYSYMAKKVTVDVEAGQLPKISPQRAVELARRAAKLTEVIEVRSQELIYRNRRLEWWIRIFGPLPKGYYGGYVVCLDAHSGEIIEASPYKLGGHEMPPRGYTMVASRWSEGGYGELLKRGFGPIQRNNLVMVREKIAEVLGGKVAMKGGRVVLKGDKTVIVKKPYKVTRSYIYLLMI